MTFYNICSLGKLGCKLTTTNCLEDTANIYGFSKYFFSYRRRISITNLIDYIEPQLKEECLDWLLIEE